VTVEVRSLRLAGLRSAIIMVKVSTCGASISPAGGKTEMLRERMLLVHPLRHGIQWVNNGVEGVIALAGIRPLTALVLPEESAPTAGCTGTNQRTASAGSPL